MTEEIEEMIERNQEFYSILEGHVDELIKCLQGTKDKIRNKKKLRHPSFDNYEQAMYYQIEVMVGTRKLFEHFLDANNAAANLQGGVK